MLAVLPTVHAQATEFGALTWDASLLEAAQGNPDLKAAKSSLKSLVYQEQGAYSGFFPQISTSLGFNYGAGLSNTGLGGGSSILNVSNTSGGGPTSSFTASLSATQNLFSGLQDKAKVDQASANVKGSTANLESVRARVSYELKSAFAGLIYAQNSINLTQEIIHRREANLRLVSLRYDSGRENKGSLLLSKAYLEQANYEHLQAMNSLQVGRAQLARVLGREETDSLQASGDVPILSPGLGQNFKELAKDIPDYRQSLAQEEAADAGIILARAPFFPFLNLTGTTSNTGSDWFPSNNRWSMGAGIVFPFFSGGRDYYAIKSASEGLKVSAYARENNLRQGLAKLNQTYAGYIEAVQKLQVDTAFVEAVSTRARIAKEKYNNGLLSFEDWDIIESDLINRQKVLLQSKRDRVVAEAAWEQAQGKGAIQ